MDQLEEFDIRQYVDALKRRWWVIAVAVVVCALVAGIVSFLQPKIYESTAKVLISAQQDTSGTGTALSDPNQLQNQMQTQIQIAESEAVKAEADRQLGADSARIIEIRAEGVTNTRVMNITASSEDPSVARRAADLYSTAYLSAGANTAVDRLSTIATSVNQKKAQLQTQINQIQAQPTTAALTQAAKDAQIDQIENQINQLQRQFDNAQAAALVREAAAEPFASALAPEGPVSPQPLRNIALALVLGLLIGIGIALIWERLDDRIRTAEQVQRWFPNLSLLGSIPHVSDWKDSDEARNETLAEPQSTTAEAYRGLRTSLEFMAIDQTLEVIEVTSASEGEGKTTTVANLATALAWSGKNVIIMNADLRRPRIQDFFGATIETGLTTLLIDKKTKLKSVLQQASVENGAEHGTIRILSTGELPPNPSEVLGSSAVEDVVAQLRKEADVVIIDAPPVLPVADPLILSRYADGVLVVAGANKVTRSELDRTFETMSKSLRAPIIGVVLNNSEEAKGYYSRYGNYKAAEPKSAVNVTPPADATVDVTQPANDNLKSS